MEWRLSELGVLDVWISFLFKKHFESVILAQLAGIMQRRLSILILEIDITAASNQYIYNLEEATVP